MTTRRGFLRMLGFAPLAAVVPVTVAADPVPLPVNATVTYTGGVTWTSMSNMPEPLGSMMAGKWIPAEFDTKAALRDMLRANMRHMLKNG